MITPAPIQQLTFDDLVALAEAKRANATSPASSAGWDRLLEVARALATGRGAGPDLVSGRRWSLIRVAVQGYQGVTEPLTIDLDPSPGITVLIGRNGSGKSSVADAIETALHGEPRAPSTTGSGGNAPLWDREHCHRDADEAHVEVTLLAGPETLTLGVRLGSDGTITRSAVHAKGGTRTEVDLAATPWSSALAGHRPVFGYATVERQVQRARNLREFLEPLLAFGGCFEELQRAVDAAGTASAAAQKQWSQARTQAQQRVAQVDRERSGNELPDIEWPEVTDDPDTWLATVQLTDSGTATPEITLAHHDRLHAAAGAAATALDELETAETAPAADPILARLTSPLTDLHRAAGHLDQHGDTCPVCRQPADGWPDTLAATLDATSAARADDAPFRKRLGELRDAVDTDLALIERVVTPDGAAHALHAAAAPALAVGAALRRALDDHGRRAVTEVRTAVRAAHTQLTSAGWREAVTAIADHTDRRRQWLRARRAAVDPFLGVWREVDAEAAAAPSWTAADKCLRALQDQLRTERTRSLRALADTSVRALLADVGLTIRGLTVQTTKADVRIVDDNGVPMRLAQLSAGQRNALLLAPLLAVARGGPFGFLVLDDPVHAFDQIRVDRLAHLIHELAADRRVVVLTHDDRLKEHLLVRSPHHDARRVHRDHRTGAVTEEPDPPMWQVLVDDARATSVKAPRATRATTPVAALVRGFCRMALDDALRHFVLQEALGTSRDPHDDLEALDSDKVKSTGHRLDAALALHPAHPRLVAAAGIVSPYMGDWNKGAHGKGPATPVPTTEIDAAEKACRTLLGLP